LWYWDLDRGGAAARAHRPQASAAFIFPEMLHTDFVPRPGCVFLVIGALVIARAINILV
jgi:hypothetical protein